MSDAGGSANINGILYQLLGTLRWTSAVLRPAEFAGDVTLILEPRGGGGDIQAIVSKRIRIEQWKAKGDGGAWSLNKIIDDVLPDLFLSVKSELFPLEAEFVFMTEGHEGKWSEAKAFFNRCSIEVPTNDPRQQIDNTAKVDFFHGATPPCTERELFDKILTTVRGRKVVRGEPITLSARKLFFLLGRFRLETTPPPTVLQNQLEDHISEFVDRREDSNAKRCEAIGLLMQQMSLGEFKFNPPELYRLLKMYGRSFRTNAAWLGVQNAMQAELESRLANEGYQAIHEVRSAIQLPVEPAIVLFTGESGCGKTWRLAAQSLAITSGKALAIWVRGTGNVRTTLDEISWMIWHYGLGHDQALHLDALAERLKEAPIPLNRSRAFVFVDNIQNYSEAAELCRYPWQDRGLTLVLSTPPAFRDALLKHNPAIRVLPVCDFSRAELNEYHRTLMAV